MQAYSTASNGAIMAFHRSGVYAVNMGLDSDNVFRIGGWSAPANLLQMTMAGNLTMAGSISGTSLAGSIATGSGASGTWGISISGNAATATTASNVNNGTLTMNVSGTGLSGSQTFTANQSGNATFTVTSNATNANTGSTIVARDASGNFSAGTITAALNGNASTATTATNATNATYTALGTSGSGGAIYENTQTIASNYSITASRNAMSAGPITINSGVTVTIPSGSNWVIV
jgi:hypothetical protein